MAFLISEQRKYKSLSQLTFYKPSLFPLSFATLSCGARDGGGRREPWGQARLIVYGPGFRFTNNQLPERHSNAGCLLEGSSKD